MVKSIKLYGERNTNTNYLSKLISLNLNTKEIPGTVPPLVMKMQEKLPGNELVRDIYFYLTYGKNLGWKHTLVKPVEALEKYSLVDSNLAFLTITKNPYSWLMSLHRNPYHQYYKEKPSFEVFLKTEWKTIGRENVKGNLANPIELWNQKNKSYLQLNSGNSLNLTTEGIFEDAAKTIQTISEKFAIERKSDEFMNYESSTKNKSKDSNYYRDYYLSEKWRENLSDEAIQIINESVDRDLMSHFNYNVL